VMIGGLVCRKLLARITDGAFEDIISAATTDNNKMQNHVPKPILEGDIHFSPIIKHYRTIIYSRDLLKISLEFKVCLMLTHVHAGTPYVANTSHLTSESSEY